MDLEQFRKAYMTMENMGNTPVRFVERQAALVSSVARFFTSIGKDKEEREKRAKNVKMAFEDMKEGGVRAKNIKELILNKPTVGTNTSRAAGRVVDAAIGSAASWNEQGSSGSVGMTTTAVSRGNSYGGQDLEMGVSYVLKAARTARKGLRIAGSLGKGVELGVVSGLDFVEHIGSVGAERAASMGKKRDRGFRDMEFESER